MNIYTSDQLIAAARTRAGLPDTTALGSDDATFLAFLTEEMWTRFVPGLLRINEDYFAAEERIAIDGGRSQYRLPKRAIGQRLRDWKIVDSAGEDTGIIGVDRARVVGNYIVLKSPEDLTGNLLEMSFFMRPGQLLLATDCRTIVGLDASTGIVTLSDDAPWTTGQLLDIHSPESGAEVKAWDVASTDVSGPTVTCNPEALDGTTFGFKDVEIGDYVVPANCAAVPGPPRELHPVLPQAGAVRICLALGSTQHEQAATAELERLLGAALQLVTPRIQNQPRRCINRDSVYFGGR